MELIPDDMEPILSITKNTTHSAVCKMFTMGINSRHRIRLRRISTEGKDSTDHSDQQWTEIDFEPNKDSHTITNLTANSVYCAHGIYKIKGSNVWSQKSDDMYFSTFDAAHKAAMVVEYWLRTIDLAQNISYDVFTEIIVEYYDLSVFEWDLQEDDESNIISHEGKRITKTKGSYFKTAYMKHPLSSKWASYVWWELTVLIPGDFFMGFIFGDYLNSFSFDDLVGSDEHSLALDVKDSNPPYIWTCSDTKIVDSVEWMYHLKENDKFRLEFDLKQMKCVAFWNGKAMGTICDSVPETFYLAVSITGHSRSSPSFETTSFEVM